MKCQIRRLECKNGALGAVVYGAITYLLDATVATGAAGFVDFCFACFLVCFSVEASLLSFVASDLITGFSLVVDGTAGLAATADFSETALTADVVVAAFCASTFATVVLLVAVTGAAVMDAVGVGKAAAVVA